MTLFFISATLLVLLCMAWLLFGVFRSQGSSTDQEAVNITLARERGATLDTALAEGAIDKATYDYEREQLEYDLAADLRLEEDISTRKGGQLTAAILVGVFLPITAGALYLHLGNPGAITQDRTAPSAPVAGANGQSAPALADLLPQMEERLAQQPDDIEGWRLLGRSYLSVGEFARASDAFEKALALDETDVPTMAQLAESLAMVQQGDLAGEPLDYVVRANELDPDNEHALWLLSIARQQAGDHESALAGFDRLISMAGDNAEALATVEQMRARSVAALGGDLGADSGADSGADLGADSDGSLDGDDSAGQSPQDPSVNEITQSNTAEESQASSAGAPATDTQAMPAASITITVSASDDAIAASDAEQSVFVYAVATDGPPMPLAVSRISVADLPATVTLDNSMAMIPNMTLSAFPSVTVGARISTTGNATSQPGDWFTEAADISPESTDELELTIDRQTP